MKTPRFDGAFRANLALLMQWRRDVRRFRIEAVPEELVDELLDLVQLSPSVGNSQPWRIVRVAGVEARRRVRDNFLACNADALACFAGDRARLYAGLKLEGLDRAPVQLAVFCDRKTAQGHGLGIQTMPEMLDYSVAGMVAMLWLAARAHGLGMGWVSILDPNVVKATLGAPSSYRLIAYLCLGWPQEDHVDPELVRFGWQDRTARGRNVRVV